jgi:hypothetical protein
VKPQNSLHCASTGTREAPAALSSLATACAHIRPSVGHLVSGQCAHCTYTQDQSHLRATSVMLKRYYLVGWSTLALSCCTTSATHSSSWVKCLLLWPLHTQWPSAHRPGHCTLSGQVLTLRPVAVFRVTFTVPQPWCGLLETWPRPGTFLTSRRRHRCRHSLEDCPRATSTSAARLDFFPSLCA